MSLRALAARAGTAACRATATATAAGAPCWSIRSASTMARRPKAAGSSQGAPQPAADAASIRELPGDEPNDVVFETRYGLRIVMLNRPKKLNSLNGSMIRKIVPRLVEWEKSDMANIIILKGAGGKALCAGGDVAALAQYNQESADGWRKSAEYFSLEYKLDHYLATYKKPYVAFMDGITMGGGVGLSIHAPFRIATEKTIFAMPETTIGFFPDVGASFFLPRMNGSVGTYLALTSDRLTGPNVFFCGIATHYLHSTSLPDLEARLGELRFRDEDALPYRLDMINDTLEEFCTGLPYDQTMQLSGDIRRAIDRCFSKDSVGEIIAALEEERGETEKWAQTQLETLHKRSPTSVHVALRQMRTGGKWNIAEAFEKEHQMASKFMQHHDFTEGVTALLVRKETPTWQPESLESVPADEDVTAPFFAFSKESSLKLLVDRTYDEYPFARFGVPTEKDIQRIVASRPLAPRQLVDEIVALHKRRQGVSDVVNEVLARKTIVDGKGKVKWADDDGLASSRL